jgi:hypothetical protein
LGLPPVSFAINGLSACFVPPGRNREFPSRYELDQVYLRVGI